MSRLLSFRYEEVSRGRWSRPMLQRRAALNEESVAADSFLRILFGVLDDDIGQAASTFREEFLEVRSGIRAELSFSGHWHVDVHPEYVDVDLAENDGVPRMRFSFDEFDVALEAYIRLLASPSIGTVIEVTLPERSPGWTDRYG